MAASKDDFKDLCFRITANARKTRDREEPQLRPPHSTSKQNTDARRNIEDCRGMQVILIKYVRLHTTYATSKATPYKRADHSWSDMATAQQKAVQLTPSTVMR